MWNSCKIADTYLEVFCLIIILKILCKIVYIGGKTSNLNSNVSIFNRFLKNCVWKAFTEFQISLNGWPVLCSQDLVDSLTDWRMDWLTDTLIVYKLTVNTGISDTVVYILFGSERVKCFKLCQCEPIIILNFRY